MPSYRIIVFGGAVRLAEKPVAPELDQRQQDHRID